MGGLMNVGEKVIYIGKRSDLKGKIGEIKFLFNNTEYAVIEFAKNQFKYYQFDNKYIIKLSNCQKFNGKKRIK
jgi:hypothetical protein